VEKRPLISIVVPAYNEEKNLPASLESLKAQDFVGGYEIIVVDNASRDRTAEVAQSYGVRLITCERRGVFFARAAGAAAAKGEIIAQADADTVYPANWLSSFARRFAEHKEAVAVGGRFFYITPPWWAPIERLVRLFFNIMAIGLLGRPFIISGANFAFKRWAFLQINGYNPYIYAADQFDLATRLSRLGRIIYDDGLKVKTSARTMQKPFFFVFLDLLIHMGKYARYEFAGTVGSVRSVMLKLKLTPARFFITGLIVVPLTFCAYGYFIPAAPVFGRIYYTGNPNEKVIALTFDDGPNEPYTSELLDVLDRYGVKATFFTPGYNVELYPETARRIVAAGHTLGNHSFHHDADHALTMQGCFDLTLAEDKIHEVTGVYPNFYRPPHGRKSPWELQYVQEQGLIAVNWSIATPELAGRTPQQMAEDIIKQARSGGIILLHDGYGLEHNNTHADKSATVEMVPLVIEGLKEKGYEFVTVAELLDMEPYH
jgi:peptidoglycan/xylan/chitin deacetylase (PgdA/CDA1 family)